VSDAFHIHNILKQGDALSPLLLKLALEYVIRTSRRSRKNEEVLELNGKRQLLKI
jgi:hypothetical protein